jgi:ribosomal protein S18 acetylase RimI-like enzyme
VLSWVTSEDEAEAWASVGGAARDPDLFARWHADPDVRPFLCVDADGEPCGYGEVWCDPEADEAELARILVDPAVRGRGVGRALVGLLAGEARGAGYRDIWLRVISWNEPALACYRAAGFVRASFEEEQEFNQGQPHDYVWMRMARTGPAG